MIVTILDVLKRNIWMVVFVLLAAVLLLRVGGGASEVAESEKQSLDTITSEKSSNTLFNNPSQNASDKAVVQSHSPESLSANKSADSPVHDLKNGYGESESREEGAGYSEAESAVSDSADGEDYALAAEVEFDEQESAVAVVADDVDGGYQEFDANWALDEEYRYISMFSEVESLSMFSLRNSRCSGGECSVVVSADREGRDSEVAQALANALLKEKGSFGIILPQGGGQEMEFTVTDANSETIN